MANGAAISDRKALKKLQSLSQRQCLVDLKFHNLAYEVKVKKSPKPILKNVSGHFKSGRLNCIMGPSGAGKSSLLNALAGLNTICRGEVIINGTPYEASKCGVEIMSSISSYIMQDDHLLGELTALETISWAARFKLLVEADEATKIAKIVLKLLGLKEVANVYIANLSGGQRKRVAVAVELVNYPPILFLDECTTGLDSTSCYRLMRLLKNLASSGVCVIATIHQPNSLVYRLFDTLYVMAPGGRLAYCGHPLEIPKALGLISVSCSLAENPADVLFEKDNIEQLAKNWYKMSDSTDFTGYKRIRLNTDGKERYYGDELKQHCQTHRGSWFNEFSMLLRRGVQTAYRDKVFTYGRFIAWGGCSLLMGQLYLNIGQDGSMIFSNTGFLYILITAMLAAPGLMAVMQSEKKLKNLTREFVNSWYSPSAFYFTNALIEGVLNVGATIVFVIACWMFSGQLQPKSSLLPAIIIYCLLVICTNHLMFIVSLQGTTESNFQLPFMLTMIQCCFGGYMKPIEEQSWATAWWWKWISYLFYGTYAYSGIMRSVYSPWDGNVPILECKINPPLCNRYSNGTDVLRMLILEPGSPAKEMGIMCISAVFFFVLGAPLLSLKMKASKRGIARI